MSEPVTNVEIEDVLSSIRRLVAEGDRLRPDQGAQPPLTLAPEDAVPPRPAREAQPEAAAADGEEANAPGSSKFVLTPALRVTEPDGEAEPSAPKGADGGERDVELKPEPSAPEVTDPAEEIAPDATLAEAPVTDDGSVFQEAAHPEEDGQNEYAWDDHEAADPAPTTLLWDEAENAEAASEAVPEPEVGQARTVDAVDDPAPRLDPAAPAYASAGRSRLESTIAELEAAITGQDDDFEPDGSEATPIMDWATDAADATFLSSRVPARTQPIEDAEEVTEPEPWSAEAEPAPIEPAIASAGTEWDASHSDSTPMEGEVDEALTAYLEEEEILDEETLRAMVTEIVHQELQGALGERITRNVRKLVRREIHRVLSSQEFD